MSDPENSDPNIDPSVVNLSEADMAEAEQSLEQLSREQSDDDANSGTKMPQLDILLANPNMWARSDPGLEDLIVNSISAEAGQENDVDSNVVAISSRSRLARSIGPFVAGIAAGLLLVFSISFLRDQDDGVHLALVGTDLAPQASAAALIDQGESGVQIKLDVSGLPPSPEGTYYQAWVRKSPEIGVSAGTFHLRGGNGEVELWAGVSTDDYPLVTVTIQQEDEGPESSGKVVLKGRLD